MINFINLCITHAPWGEKYIKLDKEVKCEVCGEIKTCYRMIEDDSD